MVLFRVIGRFSTHVWFWFLIAVKEAKKVIIRIVNGKGSAGGHNSTPSAQTNGIGCWITMVKPSCTTYPKTKIRTAEEDYVHRVAWIASNGPIDASKQVHHRCHTVRCFNPNHLQLVTDEQNRAANTHFGHFAKENLDKECAKLHPGVATCILPTDIAALALRPTTGQERAAMLSAFK